MIFENSFQIGADRYYIVSIESDGIEYFADVLVYGGNVEPEIRSFNADSSHDILKSVYDDMSKYSAPLQDVYSFLAVMRRKLLSFQRAESANKR